MTQPTGDDPSQHLMRQIIGIFDEYTSRENGKNVTRAMRKSAKQGFWNGATPPLGYRIVEAERRGSKIKKRLDIDPVEAEVVHLIFRLYSEGDGRSGPLGVKGTTKWLNKHGHRTRRGSTFGVGPLHRILNNSCYVTGKWPYGRRNSRTGWRCQRRSKNASARRSQNTSAMLARRPPNWGPFGQVLGLDWIIRRWVRIGTA